MPAENCTVIVEGRTLDYVRCGSGERRLLVIPGLSDGLRTVAGLARPLARSLRALTADFTVYTFSRAREGAPQSTREMAADLAEAAKLLGLAPYGLLGVSLGGMIAQHLALDHPQQVSRLVLAVTQARCSEHCRQVLTRWQEQARRGDYRELMRDTAEQTYAPARARLYAAACTLPFLPGRPASFDRFLAQAQAGIDHDAAAGLFRIACPTLIIGGAKDRIVTPAAAPELHDLIPGSRLYIYPELGHGLFEEAKDFYPRVRDFLREDQG